jgi:hypothetical protein
MDPRIKDLLAAHGDLALLGRVQRVAETFPGLLRFLRRGYRDGLARGGVLECRHCGTPLMAPWHPDAGELCAANSAFLPALMLDERGFEGDVHALCLDCEGRAWATRVKTGGADIYGNRADSGVVALHDLTEEERQLLSYLDADDQGAAKMGLTDP